MVIGIDYFLDIASSINILPTSLDYSLISHKLCNIVNIVCVHVKAGSSLPFSKNNLHVQGVA